MIGQLAANYEGSVYNQVVRGGFNYGAGGVAAWRSICGVPNGGMAMLTQIGAPAKVKDEYFAWYERTAFPTNAAFEDWEAAAGAWVITDSKGVAVDPKDHAPSAVPKSLLCHASHGRWLEAAGGPEGAWVTKNFVTDAASTDVVKAGADRCAKLVYDCVYKLCELINAWMAPVPVLPSGKLDPSVAACMTCHQGGYDAAIDQCVPEVTGKMKCDESCHQ